MLCLARERVETMWNARITYENERKSVFRPTKTRYSNNYNQFIQNKIDICFSLFLLNCACFCHNYALLCSGSRNVSSLSCRLLLCLIPRTRYKSSDVFGILSRGTYALCIEQYFVNVKRASLPYPYPSSHFSEV